MEEEQRLERWMERMAGLFSSLEYKHWQPYSIPIVSDEVGKWNQPQVVSMGPRFKGRKELLAMEETKWWCMRSLLLKGTTKTTTSLIKSCMDAMLISDEKVRASYGEQIELDRYDLATVMLYDGCFLLELLMCGPIRFVDLYLSPQMFQKVLSDLMLVENQIPHLVVFELHSIIFQLDTAMDTAEDIKFKAWSLFYPLDSTISYRNLVPAGAHILELCHFYVLWKNDQLSLQHESSDVSNREKQVKLKRCVTKLQAFGVRVKRSEDNSVVPICGSSKFLIKFSNGVLQIPTLSITGTTEPVWWSYIAWERHKKNIQNKNKSSHEHDVRRDMFTFFALLFHDFICCSSDLQLLKNKGIIVDHLGMRNRDLLQLFRSLANGIDRGNVDSSYNDVVYALNTYSATNPVIRFPAILCHSFAQFSEWLLHFLRRGYNFAAVLITLLTVIQTFYAVLSYHHPS